MTFIKDVTNFAYIVEADGQLQIFKTDVARLPWFTDCQVP